MYGKKLIDTTSTLAARNAIPNHGPTNLEVFVFKKLIAPGRWPGDRLARVGEFDASGQREPTCRFNGTAADRELLRVVEDAPAISLEQSPMQPSQNSCFASTCDENGRCSDDT